jgi:hypothetical protein
MSKEQGASDKPKKENAQANLCRQGGGEKRVPRKKMKQKLVGAALPLSRVPLDVDDFVAAVVGGGSFGRARRDRLVDARRCRRRNSGRRTGRKIRVIVGHPALRAETRGCGHHGPTAAPTHLKLWARLQDRRHERGLVAFARLGEERLPVFISLPQPRARTAAHRGEKVFFSLSSFFRSSLFSSPASSESPRGDIAGEEVPPAGERGSRGLVTGACYRRFSSLSSRGLVRLRRTRDHCSDQNAIASGSPGLVLPAPKMRHSRDALI